MVDKARLLILGKGEVARYLACIARAADYPVSACEAGLESADWPMGVELVDKVYSDAPWPLAPDTQAVVARGHEADPDSVVRLLEQGAGHVYLIASARRAQSVLSSAFTLLDDAMALERVSAPAGLGLGGNSSAEIALSILAEIQWRRHGGPLLPLRELRAARALKPASISDDNACPGKR